MAFVSQLCREGAGRKLSARSDVLNLGALSSTGLGALGTFAALSLARTCGTCRSLIQRHDPFLLSSLIGLDTSVPQ